MRHYASNRAKRFGWPKYKGLPKPHQFRDLIPAYLKHRTYLYDVQEVKIQFARYFHYFQIPPLAYWNPDVLFREIKVNKIPSEALLTVTKTNGHVVELNVKGLKEEQILQKLLDTCKHWKKQ